MTRRITTRRLDPDGPEGVRLRLPDGTTIGCSLRRDTALDRPDMTYWAAVPEQPVGPDVTYVVECDKWPPHTGFWIDVPGKPRNIVAAVEG